jgi:hypothetical protein
LVVVVGLVVFVPVVLLETTENVLEGAVVDVSALAAESAESRHPVDTVLCFSAATFSVRLYH